MNLTPLPKKEKDWQLKYMRSCLFAGSILLFVQIWVRTFLAGLRRQNSEYMLRPFAWLFVVLLLCCSVAAFLRRKRLLGSISAVVGLSSAVIALLPVLLKEGVYD
jgi:hypothetical protein